MADESELSRATTRSIRLRSSSAVRSLPSDDSHQRITRQLEAYRVAEGGVERPEADEPLPLPALLTPLPPLDATDTPGTPRTDPQTLRSSNCMKVSPGTVVAVASNLADQEEANGCVRTELTLALAPTQVLPRFRTSSSRASSPTTTPRRGERGRRSASRSGERGGGDTTRSSALTAGCSLRLLQSHLTYSVLSRAQQEERRRRQLR